MNFITNASDISEQGTLSGLTHCNVSDRGKRRRALFTCVMRTKCAQSTNIEQVFAHIGLPLPIHIHSFGIYPRFVTSRLCVRLPSPCSHLFPKGKRSFFIHFFASLATTIGETVMLAKSTVQPGHMFCRLSMVMSDNLNK